MADPIEIKDLYQLLSYSLRTFGTPAFERVSFSKLPNLESVLAEILIVGITAQRKKGLEHDYRTQRGDLQFAKGKIHVLSTQINRERGSLLANCSYDEYNNDTRHNQILKAAMRSVLSNKSLHGTQKVQIRALLPFFDSVTNVPASRINWAGNRYHRNNAGYRLLMHVAYMLINGLGMSQEDPEHEFTGIEVSNMPLLFQGFVTNYFKTHYKGLQVRSETVINSGIDTALPDLPRQIPRLQPDIIIGNSNKKLVIDTKFYAKILQPNRFGKPILRPAHRNQISTYVQHLASKNRHEVVGMLLYAKPTSESDTNTNFSWNEVGHQLICRTLDLNQSFTHVASSLDDIINTHFPDVQRNC